MKLVTEIGKMKIMSTTAVGQKNQSYVKCLCGQIKSMRSILKIKVTNTFLKRENDIALVKKCSSPFILSRASILNIRL